MAINYSDKRLNNYFDALFVTGKMGNPRDELMALQSFLGGNDFAEIKKFDAMHKNVIEFISRDEDEYVSPKDIDLLNEYEKMADELKIAPRYKVKMYDNVLIGVDKFAQSHTHSMIILNKIADNTPMGDTGSLERLQKMALAYKSGNGILQEKLDKTIKLKLKSKNPIAVNNAKQRFKEISEELKKTHSKDERIELLQEQLALADKCAFRRMEKFQTKSAICYDLANEYAGQRDIFNHDKYLNESQYYGQLVKNIVKHAKYTR